MNGEQHRHDREDFQDRVIRKLNRIEDKIDVLIQDRINEHLVSKQSQKLSEGTDKLKEALDKNKPK